MKKLKEKWNKITEWNEKIKLMKWQAKNKWKNEMKSMKWKNEMKNEIMRELIFFFNPIAQLTEDTHSMLCLGYRCIRLATNQQICLLHKKRQGFS